MIASLFAAYSETQAQPAEWTQDGKPASQTPCAAGSDAVFLGPDGKPLPSEKQEELRRLFKGKLPVCRPKTNDNDQNSLEASHTSIITVAKRRPRGSVIGDAEPSQVLSPIEMGAYGASNLGELLAALQNEIASAGDNTGASPVLLLNGKRIADFRQIAALPTDAIERTEVFSEEVALRFGYRSDQKIVNVVTYVNYESWIGRAGIRIPTAGAGMAGNYEAGLFRIRKESRLTLIGTYLSSASISESERNILLHPGESDERVFRTLLPASRQLTLSGSFAGPWIRNVDSSIHGTFEHRHDRGLSGLGVGPIEDMQRFDTASFGATFGGAHPIWSWSLSVGADVKARRGKVGSAADRQSDDVSRSRDQHLYADGFVTALPFNLPAGPVSATLSLGTERSFFRSSSISDLGATSAQIERGRMFARIATEVPLLKRTGASGGTALSAIVDAGAEHLSDKGLLTSLGYGLRWAPSKKLTLVASLAHQETSPSLEQLGSAVVAISNARIYDFSSGRFVAIERVFGGNANLANEGRRRLRLSMTLKPITAEDLTFTLGYGETRISNPIIQLPFVSTEAEAIVPERYNRSSDGSLFRIDSRPLNFRQSDSSSLRWSVSFAHAIGAQPKGSKGDARFFSDTDDIESQYPKGTIIQHVEAGSPEAREAEQANNRFVVSLGQTIRLREFLNAPDGISRLNLLDGFAVSSSGSNPRYSFNLQSGFNFRGVGAQLFANWDSGGSLRERSTSVLPSPNDLRFSPVLLVDMSAYVNLGDRFEWARKVAFLKRARVSLSIANIFDSKRRVKDGSGLTPYNYQLDYLDPVGRSLTLQVKARL
jgi:hypothetical protein